MPSIIFNTNRNNLDIVARGRLFPNFKESVAIGITFGLTVFAWIFFRANTVEQAINYISFIFSSSVFTIPYFRGIGKAVIIVPIIFLFMLIEWIGREGQYAISRIGLNWKKPYRYFFYYVILFMILYFGNFNENQFIYFQF